MTLTFRASLSLLAVLALAGCGLFAEKPAPKPVAVKTMQSDQYLGDLALARLALASNPQDLEAVQPYLKTLDVPAKGKSKKREWKNRKLQAVILEYTLPKKKEQQTLLVPVAAEGKSEFEPLRKVMEHLSAEPYTLQELRTSEITLHPSALLPLSWDNPTLLAEQLLGQQRQIQAKGRSLPVPEDARLQLELTRLFMDIRARDAAYLALENAKQLLAHMAEKGPADGLPALSEEAKDIESRLHKELPYRL